MFSNLIKLFMFMTWISFYIFYPNFHEEGQVEMFFFSFFFLPSLDQNSTKRLLLSWNVRKTCLFFILLFSHFRGIYKDFSFLSSLQITLDTWNLYINLYINSDTWNINPYTTIFHGIVWILNWNIWKSFMIGSFHLI